MVTILSAYCSTTGVIGNKGSLPWPSLKSDFQFMKYITTRRPSGIVMGSKTFKSIGRPLPNRTSIVLTSADISPKTANEDSLDRNSPLYPGPVEGSNYKVYYRRSLKEAIDLCSALSLEPIVFGGERVYREAMETYPCTLYITEVYKEYEGDARFPIELIDRRKMVNITEEVLGLIGREICTEELHKKNLQCDENRGNAAGSEEEEKKRGACINGSAVCDNNVFYSFFKFTSSPHEK
ncbi:dihydrofolate reductase [Nematocida minor]|uniref:dihydrofolate reductase n=1 Tax=Nematocida minor TaxID=1912983 RepID=UPI00221E469F|nr:dihydrofolate reductase [Nematocida minor]KAI5192471.1 dihydrofolate reductase [Nematocida minor]